MAARKNQVFSGAGGDPDHAQSQSMASSMPVVNVLRDDFGYEVPVERIPLPSGGLVYPRNHPLHNVEAIDIKAMTAREEDILLSRALSKQGTTMSALISACLVDKRIDPRTLISGDRLAIVLGIRITGYGSQYKSDVSCQSCQVSSRNDFDIGQLDVKPLEIAPSGDENLFEFVLPMTKKRVLFKFLTGQDEEDNNAIIERKQKLFPNAPEGVVTTRLESHIVSVDGVSDKSKISKFVSAMPAGDSRALRTYIEKNEPGVNLEVSWRCSYCGFDNRNTLPMGTLFFWAD
jgi:hypothetical protein